MNKKLFLGMFAAATMLFATSCQNDELDAVQAGNEATVSFTLGVEGGVQTRAISDGTGAKKLVYAVYDVTGNLLNVTGSVNGQFVENAFENGLEDEVTVTLAKGQTYTIAFWAQNETCTAYNTDNLKAVSVTYPTNALNNDESRDAFFAAKTFTVDGHTTIPVTLKRPFAQINVGVTDTDWNAAVASGIDIATSKVVIKDAATSINLLDGSVSGNVDVTYDFAATPKSNNETLYVDLNEDNTAESYNYLSMSYILVNDGSDGAQKATLQDLEFTFHPNSGNDIVFGEGLNSVPVQRNWRTNIIGQILTGNIHFTIKIDPAYINDYNHPFNEEIAEGITYDKATNTYGISNANGLIYANKNLFTTDGNSYKLLADIDMTGITWESSMTIDTDFSFDGAGHTISNWETKGHALFVPHSQYNFATIKNLTLKNCKVDDTNASGNQGAGLFFGYVDNGTGEITIDNCDIVGGSVTGADYAAGFVGYYGLPAEIKITNSSVKDITIIGGGSAGAYVGHASANTPSVTTIEDAIVTGCTIKGGKADKTGIVVGTAHIGTVSITTSDLSDNDVFDVADSDKIYGRFVPNGTGVLIIDGVATVSSTDGLAKVVGIGITTINLVAGDYIIPNGAAGKDLTLVGSGDNTIISIPKGQGLSGSTLNFEKVKIAVAADASYTGFQHIAGATYNDCTIEGQVFLYGSSTFKNCTFSNSGDNYNVWTYGSNVTFTGCTFNCDGKAVLVYNEGEVHDTVTFTDCTFNDNGDGTVSGKAAIEFGESAYGNKAYHTAVITGCEVNGFDINSVGISTGSTLWGNKNSLPTDQLSVTVDGVKVY